MGDDVEQLLLSIGQKKQGSRAQNADNKIAHSKKIKMNICVTIIIELVLSVCILQCSAVQLTTMQ